MSARDDGSIAIKTKELASKAGCTVNIFGVKRCSWFSLTPSLRMGRELVSIYRALMIYWNAR